MGCRAHCVTKYEKEFAEDENFNWKQQEFMDTLGEYDCSYYSEEGEGYCTVEITEGDWDAFLKAFEEDKGARSCMGDEYTYDDLMAIFKSYVVLPNYGMVRLEWF